MRRGIAAVIPTFLVVFVAVGCGGGGGSQITGKITLDGSPLADADIEFEKRDKEGVAKFNAKSDAEGKFKVPVVPGRVIRPGTYQVMVTKWVDKKGKAVPPEDIEQIKAAGTAKNILPEKYSDPTSSPLKAEIKEGKTEVPTLELASKGK
jgi:hypothetical protein